MPFLKIWAYKVVRARFTYLLNYVPSKIEIITPETSLLEKYSLRQLWKAFHEQMIPSFVIYFDFVLIPNEK